MKISVLFLHEPDSGQIHMLNPVRHGLDPSPRYQIGFSCTGPTSWFDPIVYDLRTRWVIGSHETTLRSSLSSSSAHRSPGARLRNPKMSATGDAYWLGKKPPKRLGGMAEALSIASDLGFTLPALQVCEFFPQLIPNLGFNSSISFRFALFLPLSLYKMVTCNVCFHLALRSSLSVCAILCNFELSSNFCVWTEILGLVNIE